MARPSLFCERLCGWNSPYINHFIQPDTIIPDQTNSQSWDRYSYVLNNPMRFTDPTGHKCSPEDECSGSQYSLADRISILKSRIKHNFGVEMSDDKGKWDMLNLTIVFNGLGQADRTLGGKAKSIVDGSIFYLKSAATDSYSGLTSGMKITFSTSSSIPFLNLYHEFAHLLDNGLHDSITNKLSHMPTYYGGEYLFGGSGAGEISKNTLTYLSLDDPYRINDVKVFQHASSDPVEQWADMFANLVAGNINDRPQGQIMNAWTRALLYPYVGLP